MLSFFHADAFQQPIQVLKHYSQEEGLPSPSVNVIEQDKEGFIWIGTDIGLSRFDGYRFRNYTIIDGLPDNWVLDIQCDKQGRLWIITKDGLCYFKDNMFYTNVSDEDASVTSFLVARSGNLWLTSKDKLYVLDSTLNKIWTSENIETPLNSPIIHFEDNEGFVYLYNEYDHLLKINESEVFIIPLNFPHSCNTGFKAYFINENIYYSSEKGLIELEQNLSDITDIPIYKKVKSLNNTKQSTFRLPDKNMPFHTALPFLFKDSKNTVWTADQQGNFTMLDLHERNVSGLPNHLIASNAYEDKTGNLWLATKNDGIYILDISNEGSGYNVQLLLEGEKVKKLHTLNELTLAYSNNQLYKIDENQAELLDINPNRAEIKAVAIINENDILWSTEDKLFRYDGTLKSYYLPNIQAMAVRDNTLFYGTNQVAKLVSLSELPTSPIDNFKPIGKAMLNGRNIKNIYIDSKGACWIGTESGLHWYSQDSVFQYRDKNVIFGHGISAIAETSDSTIWVATKGAGVLGIRGENYLQISADKQLSHDYCTDLVTDGNVVWVATSKGVNRISDIDFNDRSFYVKFLYKLNGFNLYDIHSVAINDKQVLCGTQKGLVKIDKRYFHRADSLAKVSIVEVVTGNNERLTFQDNYEFSYRNNAIRIHYSALDYSRQSNIVYEYKMIGVDNDWQRTRASSTPLYVLPPDDYLFQVRILSGKDKNISKIEKINIRITPPFWGSNVFRVIMGVLGVWLIISFYKMYADRKKNAELQKLVAQRTADLNEKVNELERSNNELEEFSYVVAHDLKAPLRTMYSFLQLLERRDGDRLSEEGKEYVGYIGKGAKRLQEVIKDLLAFAGINKADNTLEEVDLNRIVDVVCDNLQGVIRSKKVIIEKDDLPVVKANNSQMLQVFQNLISNGIKYQNADNQPIIKIKVDKREENWLFVVQDNGIGIDIEYEDKVFRIFQRLHNDEEYSGTGIGLPIVKKIVESNGGEIYFESTIGEGTSFFFTFPI